LTNWIDREGLGWYAIKNYNEYRKLKRISKNI